MAQDIAESAGTAPDPRSKLQEVADAVLVLDYAVSRGLPVDDATVAAIKRLELTIYRAGEEAAAGLPPDIAEQDLAAFQRAYRDLAQTAAPITADSLRDTSDACGRPPPWLLGVSTLVPAPLLPAGARARLPRISEAKRWSRILWAWTYVILALIVAYEIYDQILTRFYPLDDEADDRGLHIVSSAFAIVVPFLYGGLGACAFLLRTCHEHIQKRQFDRHRIPEYYSRILLGIVSGGAILLFVDRVVLDSGEEISIGSAALGFLAGYNTDFLFKTVERVAEALLPKVGVETMRRARGAAPPSAAVAAILDRLKAAQSDEEKAFLMSLLRRLGAGNA